MNRNLAFLTIALVVIGIIAGIFILSNSSEETESTTTVPKVPTVGLLVQSEEVGLFLKFQLSELGYVEGESIQYMEVSITDPAEQEAAIQSVIDADVDVIFAAGPIIAQTASNMADTLPIVFMANANDYSNEIALGNEREGETNLTGVISTNSSEKRFELLMQMVPSIEVLYVPYDPSNGLSLETVRLLEEVAPSYGVTLEKYEFTDNAGGQQALDEMPEDVDAIFMGSEPATLLRINQWAELSLKRGIPAILPLGQVPGGFFPPAILMGYGSGIDELYQQVAELIDQVLQGTPVSDLPPRPSDIYLTISLGAAEAFNIEVPDSVLDQANEVVREEVIPPTAEAGDETVVESVAACNATLVSPLGENTVCINRSCDSLVESTFTTFTDRTEVATCTTENLLGICARDDSEIYFYSGDISAIEIGCPTNGGVWKAPSE